MRTTQKSTLIVATLFACGASIQAAEITYVGHQVGVEQDADDPEVGWRNPEPAKPLDIDGDNILGTDGWWLANHKSEPSYAWIKNIAPNGNGSPGWGKWDNPADPAGPDTLGAFILHNARGGSLDAFELVIHGDALDGKTLRLGILYSVIGAAKSTFTLTQTVGGRQRVTSPPLDYDGSALDVAFFNVSDLKDGDTFIVSAKAIEGGPHVAGITFDTAPTAAVPQIAEPEGVVRTLYDAPFEIAKLFGNNAVLQRNQPVPVWGWHTAGTEVTVQFAGQTVKGKADALNRWDVTLAPMEASKTPQVMTVTAGSETITITNLLVGDVWLCAGQSNMEMHFSTPFVAPQMPCDTPEFVKPEAYPTIRHLRIGTGDAGYPQTRLPKSLPDWSVCGAEAYKTFTAAGFFFAYTVSQEVDVPIGLINVAAGNTRIGSWVSSRSIDLVKEHVPRESFRAVYSPTPCTLFNGRIAPMAGLAIKGMLWYQGEANGGEGDSYFWKMKALISGWREAWGRSDIPFYFAQLPSMTGNGPGWAPTREAQRKVLAIPHTGMAVLTDAGDTQAPFPSNLHPRNKYTVGRRLALWALANEYGRTDLVHFGPLFTSAEFKDGKAVVSFDHVGSGLMAAKKENTTSPEPPRPVSELEGFEIAGPDGKWVAANAVIEGATVVVGSPDVEQPTAVRYLHTMNTDHGTFYNKEGLPASPFTTGK